MNLRASRRGFLKSSLAASFTAPFISRISRGAMPAGRFDPDFGTASEAIGALRSGIISSRELVERTFERIKKFNPRINAFIMLLEEQAREEARQADETQAAGKLRGLLHGLPIVIKDSFETAGIRTTSGSKTLLDYVPKEDATAVGRLRAAGGIIIGKTNLPEFAGDVQTYNAVAGTTNNPWDLRRTPGGSTGGGAAAIAAGFGFLELGSDIGGSIRTPANFCGVYGHKPTLNVVPPRGHIPPPPGSVRPVVDLNVAGPLARSAQDLQLDLEVIAGPERADAKAYSWRLPPARGARLKDYRIGYVLDDPFCPVTPEVREVLARTIDALRKQGANLSEGWPEGVNPQSTLDVFVRLLAAALAPTYPQEELRLMRESLDKPWGYYARRSTEGQEITHREWLAQSLLRLKARDTWQEYFKTHDVFLLPEDFITAFPHDHTLTFFERTVDTSQGKRLYGDTLRWICFATLTGCPATVAPVGRTEGGLPVGIQIIGPYLEDATPIQVAGLLADVTGGYQPPPGYTL